MNQSEYLHASFYTLDKHLLIWNKFVSFSCICSDSDNFDEEGEEQNV